MRLLKTPANKRFRQEEDGTKTPIFTIYFDNGDKVIYEPGKATTVYAKGGSWVQIEEGITELTIKQLYNDEDNEIKQNIRDSHCETAGMEKARLAKRAEWTKEHPDADDSENPYNATHKLVSLDYKPSEDFDSDHSELELEIAKKQQEEEDSSDDERDQYIEMIRAYVATLPKSQQELYQLHYVEGLNQTQICEKLHLSKSTVSERCKTLEQKLFKKFKK